MAYQLIGKNFTPPDVRAQGDRQGEICGGLPRRQHGVRQAAASPIPHAKIVNIDTSEALKMPGVLGILTADDVPKFPEPQEQILTKAPRFVGQPILAVAAESEETAADAIERSRSTTKPLPFVTDPLASLYPGGPNAYPGGNVTRQARQDASEASTSGGSSSSSGRRAISPRPARTSFPKANRWPSSGLTAMSMLASRKPSSCSMRASSSKANRIIRWSREAASPIGRTASASCTDRRKARASSCRALPDTSAVKPQQLVYIAEYLRRRLRLQGQRLSAR